MEVTFCYAVVILDKITLYAHHDAGERNNGTLNREPSLAVGHEFDDVRREKAV